VGILLFLGYFLGNAYNMLSDNLKYYFIAWVICVIPLSLYLMNRYLKTKIIDSWSLL
jgi:membrane protein DedA with SNARE-associated domain